MRKKGQNLGDRLEGLIEEARRMGRHRTRNEAVTAALEEYIRRPKQLAVLSLFGTIVYDENYDYKQTRHRRLRGESLWTRR
ncbi:MAG TPA: type II toxin-antitoxin system VapB family antitoxin [Bryobacteraceae bacterium]